MDYLDLIDSDNIVYSDYEKIMNNKIKNESEEN
jgi:hypothetical protein